MKQNDVYKFYKNANGMRTKKAATLVMLMDREGILRTDITMEVAR